MLKHQRLHGKNKTQDKTATPNKVRVFSRSTKISFSRCYSDDFHIFFLSPFYDPILTGFSFITLLVSVHMNSTDTSEMVLTKTE